jgi:hypothetical protein
MVAIPQPQINYNTARITCVRFCGVQWSLCRLFAAGLGAFGGTWLSADSLPFSVTRTRQAEGIGV